MEKRAPRPMSQVLQRVVRTLDMEERLREWSVDPVWRRAVGAMLAAQAWPVRLRGGVLLVEVRSASWMNELSMLRERVRKAVNRELGREAVRELRFRRGPAVPRVPEDAPAVAPEAAPTAAELERAEAELRSEGAGEGARLAARARAMQKRRS